MKAYIIFYNRIKKELTLSLGIIAMLLASVSSMAQPATVSAPIATGLTTCAGATSQQMEFTFTGSTSTLANNVTCTPNLAAPGYSSSGATVAFNPADGYLYYTRFSGSPANSYVWRWRPNQCPTGAPLAVYQTFLNQVVAGIAFDPNGTGYQINFYNATAPYGITLQKIDFALGTVGAQDTIYLPAGVNIYAQTGDIVYTPSGQLFFLFNGKMFTVDDSKYLDPIDSLKSTYIDTVDVGGGGNRIVGLAYADGSLIASIRGTTCSYRKLNVFTGDTTFINYAGTYSARDLTAVISGIGSAKRLVSATPTATPGTYDLVYDVYVQNYGNVPDSAVMVSDNLAAVFGIFNVLSTNLAWVGTPPAGFTLNPAYNGIFSSNLITTAATNVLNNFPVVKNNFTIRITCRVQGIIPGVVYNNNARVTATGYKTVALSDMSTNGMQPDLNTNDKADDNGESQPTPFIINVAAETPPCSALTSILYNQTFGSGTGLTSTLPGVAKTQYTGAAVQPIGLETYSLSNNANNGDLSRWINLTDHTGGANGRMLLVNADVLGSKIFIDTVTIQCTNLKYSFFGYVAFIGNATNYKTFCDAYGGFKYPKLIFVVRNASTGSIITNITTPDITSNNWNQFGMKFVMPSGVARVIIEVYNAGEGGCGNDLALDDIQFGLCDPQPTISASAPAAGCLGGTAIINTTLSDTTGMGSTLVYQWQSSPDGISSWTDVSLAVSPTLTISPMTAGDSKYYRIIVAAAGNISNVSCRYISPNIFLPLKTSSVVATGANKDKGNICPTMTVNLSVRGGTLGSNAVWRWYTGSCGGTLVGTGASISVSPAATTTYYVRAEGDCNVTACVPVTVTVACDIDDDDDGIPDIVESGGVDPLDDADADGIANYLDATYPGFVDANTDGINDNFDYDRDGIINELDRDSDNDGIPDVAEAGGVDANGDGIIDNYSDTDADGLSQNVDANITGYALSGNGLGPLDTDGDGIANQFDLDSDNDGIPDVREAQGTDANNDGKIDGFTDGDANGISDNVQGGSALLRTGADIGGDGRADSYPNKNFDSDLRAQPYDLDSDNDGISDVREAGFADADNNGFSDGIKGADGWDDGIDALVILTLRNTDGVGNPNYLDIDSDDDGIPDNVEGIATSGYQFALNLDGDNDGLDNRYDLTAGFGGNGITPNDQDVDGSPDYIDSDTDNDGLIDRIEGNDFNLNNVPDDLVTLTGLDTDGDGLDNRFDNNNLSIKGTSRYMGTLGSNVGDPSPGSTTMVQATMAGSERDWRITTFVLDANFIAITASKNADLAKVNWVVSCDKIIDHFDISRSIDGINFSKAGEVRGISTICKSTPFSFSDDLSTVNSSVVYYRVTAVTTDNKYKHSQLVVVRSLFKSAIIISPNPASTFVNVSLNIVEAVPVEIHLLDAAGKLVTIKKFLARSGSNTFNINELENLAKGIYTITVKAGAEIQHKKLSIQH